MTENLDHLLAVDHFLDKALFLTQSLLLPVDAYFAGRPILILKAGPEKKVRNGAAVSVPQAADGQYRVYGESGAFLALGQVSNGLLTTIKSFFEV